MLRIGRGFWGRLVLEQVIESPRNARCITSHFDRYPGARVDSEAPFYQLNIPEVYRNWEFSERFPGHQELREYMAHTDKTLDLRKDTHFNARVVDAQRNEDTNKWTMKTQQGHTASGKLENGPTNSQSCCGGQVTVWQCNNVLLAKPISTR